MDAAILDVYGNQSVGTGGADPVQLSADAGSTGNYLYDVKEKEDQGIMRWSFSSGQPLPSAVFIRRSRRSWRRRAGRFCGITSASVLRSAAAERFWFVTSAGLVSTGIASAGIPTAAPAQKQ